MQVLLSRNGKAPQLQLSEDRLAVTGTKGFRIVRASHGAAQVGVGNQLFQSPSLSPSLSYINLGSLYR